MHIKKLFFPGEFDDAYIYMQKLLLFDADGRLFFVDLDRLVYQLEGQRKSDVKSIATHLFSRNEWLSGERFTSIFANKLIHAAYINAIKHFPNQIEIDKKLIQSIGETKVTDLLDVTIYNKRVYMGTDSGTFHIDLTWNDRNIEIDQAPQKRHDAMCTQINAKYGSVSISCGDDGLFTKFDEFGFLEDENKTSHQWNEFNQGKSFKTTWLFDDLLNYTSPTEPMLLRVIRSNKTIYQDKDARTYDKVATGFDGEPENIGYLLDNIPENRFNINSPLLSLFNTFNSFYAQNQERMLFEVPIKRKSDSEELIASKSKLIFGDLSGKILDITTFKRKNINILEFYNSVKMLVDNKLYTLAEGEALSIKSYPYSKRFQNIVTIVVQEGVYVISIFDDEKIS